MPRRGGVRLLAVYVGLAVLLAAGSLIAVKSRDPNSSTFPRVLVPGSGASCMTPPNGFLFSQSVDGVQMTVCISQEGNINQIGYPDSASGHTQIAFDGYCLFDSGAFLGYTDYSPGAGVSSSGFGAATLTQQASNQLTMTRNTVDGKYQISAFIKIAFQPRSIFVGMTVRNIDPANVSHVVSGARVVAPALDGSAVDDEYNAFGGSASVGRTGQAFQSSGPNTNSLLFGSTQSTGQVRTAPVSNFQAVGGCGPFSFDPAGHVAGGNRVLVAGIPGTGVAPNQVVSLGKFVYRML